MSEFTIDRKIFRKISILPRKSQFGGASVVQMGKRKMQVFDFQALAFCWVPGAGIEPARIAPLVFETSASTDSAIRAGDFRQASLSENRYRM